MNFDKFILIILVLYIFLCITKYLRDRDDILEKESFYIIDTNSNFKINNFNPLKKCYISTTPNEIRKKATKKWEENYTWQPLLVAISIVIIIAIIHKAHWEITTETDPLSVWNERKMVENDNMTTITYNDEKLLNKTITFKGVLEIFPYTNTSIGSPEQSNGTFDEMDGLVYSENSYKKCMISLNGMRILINGKVHILGLKVITFR